MVQNELTFSTQKFPWKVPLLKNTFFGENFILIMNAKAVFTDIIYHHWPTFDRVKVREVDREYNMCTVRDKRLVTTTRQ